MAKSYSALLITVTLLTRVKLIDWLRAVFQSFKIRLNVYQQTILHIDSYSSFYIWIVFRRNLIIRYANEHASATNQGLTLFDIQSVSVACVCPRIVGPLRSRMAWPSPNRIFVKYVAMGSTWESYCSYSPLSSSYYLETYVTCTWKPWRCSSNM